MPERGRIWIGTSGYVYGHWRKGVFYPPKLRIRDELTYYASHFSTVELNNSFYRLPTPEMFQRWRDVTPPNFCFAVKGSRFITHVKRMRNVEDALALFLERAEQLGSKLGPVLFQLPPTQQVDPTRLRDFLTLLPAGRRWVVEFRHPSWHTREIYQLLSAFGVALCIPVGGGLHPDRITTAPFTYIRMHRGQGRNGSFTSQELRYWTGQLGALIHSGKDGYVYFNNDWEGFAVKEAGVLQELLGLGD